MSKVIRECCYFSLPRYVIGSENSRHLLNQSDSILKLITTWLHAFSRALGCLRVFASSSRWLIIIFPCYVWLLWWFGIWLYSTRTKRDTRSNSKVTYFASAFIHFSFIILFSQATESELGSFSPDDIKDFSPPQVVEFLAQLVDKVKKHKTNSLFLIPPDIQLLVS